MLCHELCDTQDRESGQVSASQDAAIISPRHATTPLMRRAVLHSGDASIIFPSTIIRLYGAAAPAALRGNQTTLLPARFEPGTFFRVVNCGGGAATTMRFGSGDRLSTRFDASAMRQNVPDLLVRSLWGRNTCLFN